MTDNHALNAQAGDDPYREKLQRRGDRYSLQELYEELGRYIAAHPGSLDRPVVIATRFDRDGGMLSHDIGVDVTPQRYDDGSTLTHRLDLRIEAR